jgi:GWxTD domain-containing protein
MRKRFFPLFPVPVVLFCVIGLISCGYFHSGGPRSSAERVLDLLAKGDTTEAVRQFERSNLNDARDPGLFVILGGLYRDRNTIQGRLQSQRLLERALQLFPRHPELKLELGKTYFSQTFYPDALRHLSTALQLDSTLCEANYYLGLYNFRTWKRVNEFTDNLEIARRHFYDLVSCDPSHVAGTVKYLFCLYALGDKETAATFCDEAVIRLGKVPQLIMMRAVLAYDEGRFEEAHEDFAIGLPLLDPMLRREYSDICQMLPYYDRSVYATSTNARRQVIERIFWAEYDPDPTTPVNERQLEHTYRMFLADLYFSITKSKILGWDTERGATFVKFGWPWEITSTLGDSWMSGRIERWYFKGPYGIREFVYVDQYLNGNMRIPIAADNMVAVLKYEPRSSNFISDALVIPGELNVTAFKDDDMTSRVYISVRIDADSLTNGINLEEINHFFFRGSFFDNDWLPEKRFADTLWTSEVKTTYDKGGRFYYLTRSVAMPFDFYHVACTFQDELGLANSLFKTYGDTYRYAGDGLTVSDILLQKETRRETPYFDRNGIRLYPNTSRRYYFGQRLLVYFEVYNLHTAGKNNDYDVSFAIYESAKNQPSSWRKLGSKVASIAGLGKDKQPSIAQTIHRSGVGYLSNEEIAINIDSLEDGRYELIVSVDDKISGEKAQSSVFFFKNSVR